MVAYGRNASLTSLTPSCMLEKADIIIEASTVCCLSSVCACSFSVPQNWQLLVPL